MVLNKYGSIVFLSDSDFSIWRKKNDIKKIGGHPHSVSVPTLNVKKQEKELQKQGYKTKVMPIVFNGHQYVEYWEPYTEEEKKEYILHELLFRYIYIYERLGIEYAEQWINSFDPKYDAEEIEVWSANKPQLPHCNKVNEQCSIFCPYHSVTQGCVYGGEEQEKHQELFEKYSFHKKKKGYER